MDINKELKMESKTLLVMAKSYARFVGYKIEHHPLINCKYINKYGSICGFANCEMEILEGSGMLDDYYHIIEYAEDHNIKLIYK